MWLAAYRLFVPTKVWGPTLGANLKVDVEEAAALPIGFLGSHERAAVDPSPELSKDIRLSHDAVGGFWQSGGRACEFVT